MIKFIKLSMLAVAIALFQTSNAMIELLGLGVGSEVADFIKNNKSPIRIVGLNGWMPHEYDVIQTTINIKDDGTRPQGQLGPSPIIERLQLGKVSPPQKTASIFEAKLETPNIPLDLNKATYNLPEIATKIAGAVDPQAGAVAGAVSGLVEIGLQMASEQLNKLFGINTTTLSFIDIFPKKYYTYNTSTNEIELLPKFKEDLEKYTTVYNQAITKATQFNNANKQYQDARLAYKKKYGTYEVLEDASAEQEREYDEILDMYQNKVAPALKQLASELVELEQYGMHRIGIMAANTKPGGTCGDGWKGPFRLYVYYYLGAKITNIFGVEFCVSAKQKVQNVRLDLSPNSIKTSPTFQFTRGGFKFIATDKDGKPCKGDDCLIGFPRIQEGKKVYSNESELYSWWDSAITSADEAGLGLTQYLLPFDMYKLQKELKDEQQAKRDEVSKKALDAVTAMTDLLGKKDLKDKLLDPLAKGDEGTGPKDIDSIEKEMKEDLPDIDL